MPKGKKKGGGEVAKPPKIPALDKAFPTKKKGSK
jgi:hypothetical protein